MKNTTYKYLLIALVAVSLVGSACPMKKKMDAETPKNVVKKKKEAKIKTVDLLLEAIEADSIEKLKSIKQTRLTRLLEKKDGPKFLIKAINDEKYAAAAYLYNFYSRNVCFSNYIKLKKSDDLAQADIIDDYSTFEHYSSNDVIGMAVFDILISFHRIAFIPEAEKWKTNKWLNIEIHDLDGQEKRLDSIKTRENKITKELIENLAKHVNKFCDLFGKKTKNVKKNKVEDKPKPNQD